MGSACVFGFFCVQAKELVRKLDPNSVTQGRLKLYQDLVAANFQPSLRDYIGSPAGEIMGISVASARNQGPGLSLSLPETRLNCACGGLVNGTQIRQHS
jgi:hypothetical protein